MKFEHEVPVWEAYIENDLCEEERNRVDETARKNTAYLEAFEQYKKQYAHERLYWKKQIDKSRKTQYIKIRNRNFLVILLILLALAVILFMAFRQPIVKIEAASAAVMPKDTAAAQNQQQTIQSQNNNIVSPQTGSDASIKTLKRTNKRSGPVNLTPKKDSVKVDSISVKTHKHTDIALAVPETMSAGKDTMPLSSWVALMDDLSVKQKGQQAFTDMVVQMYIRQEYDSLLQITQNLERINSPDFNVTSLVVKSLTLFRLGQFREAKEVLVYLDTHCKESTFRNEIKWNLMIVSFILKEHDDFCTCYRYVTRHYPQLEANGYEERIDTIKREMRRKNIQCYGF